MFSKRALEGVLVVDHRNSPGLTDADLLSAGLDPRTHPHVGKGAFYESATITCAHCQAIVILNPQRSRPRNYCAHCDHYVCDLPQCVLMAAGTLPHRSMEQVFDDVLNAAAKASGPIIL